MALETQWILDILFEVGSWIYFAFAFMAIAKRINLSYSGISWIPYLGPLIIAFKASKMHWWPWLLTIPAIVGLWYISIWSILGGIGGLWQFYLALAFVVPLVVFFYIWQWKMFKAVGRPGWWALVSLGVLISYSSYISWIFFVANYVLIGIAAWGKPKKEISKVEKSSKKKKSR